MVLIGLGETYEKKDTVSDNESESVEDYRLFLEESLTDLISQIEGAGEVKIMVTLESGEENVYVTQEKSDRNEQSVSSRQSNQTQNRMSYENEIVMTEESGHRQALISKTIHPQVQGVAIVCQGADNIKVVSDITNAVAVVLNISTNRICVIKMQ
ncbi:MAG: hypothetical protein IKU54_02245 [Oscillospiraceae bacterium]|nr:hypothetical protein [Oscillospiraceae bacterium]